MRPKAARDPKGLKMSFVQQHTHSFSAKACPHHRERRWIPMIWLPYVAFFILSPVADHAPARVWMWTGIGTILFLFAFFGMFWSKGWKQWFCVGALVAMGILFAPVNHGSATFFIYAAAFTPFLAKSETAAVKVLVFIVAIAALTTWMLHLSGWFLFYAGGFATVLSVGNMFFAQRNRANEKLRMAHEEIEHLAKVAERERIARDLHDVLGHTLTAIIVKSELAEKTMQTQPEQARKDIQDIHRTAREALTEVRHTIRGYRAHSLDEELNSALATLESSGVSVKSETKEIKLSPAQESVVALVVREAVTNVVRHAKARNCSLRLIPLNGDCVLEIADDGLGGVQIEGNGLRGMRERIEALGGTIDRQTEAGTKLTIQFPLAHPNGAH